MLKRAIATALMLASPAWATAPTNCFSQSDLANVTPSGLRVEQVTTCPASDTPTNYKYFPQTACVSSQLNNAQTSTWDVGLQSARLWVNRADDGPTTHKPNPPDGPDVLVNDGVHGSHPCFQKFSTKDIADAVTASKVAYVIGRPSSHNNRNGWLDYTRFVGLADANVLEWADFVTGASTICTGVYSDSEGTWYYSTDYAVMPSAKLSTVPTTPTGKVELDYERHDCDSTLENCAARTSALVKETAQNAHALGYQFGIYTNPLYGNAAQYNGIDATNASYLLGKVDTFGLLVWPANPQGYSVSDDLDLQLSYFTSPDESKFNLVADMQMTSSQATTLRDKITNQHHFGGVEFWYHGQAAGGSCTTAFNVVEATLLGI